MPVLGLKTILKRRRGSHAVADTTNGANVAPRQFKTLVRRLLVFAVFAIPFSAMSAYAVYTKTMRDIGPAPIAVADDMSVTVVDRNGALLRAFTTTDGLWRLPVTTKDVDAKYLAMLLAFEDSRFHSHHGVDPRAVVRAAAQMLVHRRLVSGASTLTMQVARLIDRKHERTAGGKLRQMARALQLERRLTKDQILQLYLRLAPFGGNIEGVRAASWAYFGKEPRRLSLGQAATLVALPQSPEGRRLDRNAGAARIARNRVLRRAVAAGIISEIEAERAMRERVPTARLEFPKLAPHLTETEVALRPQKNIHALTLDKSLQTSLETLVSEQARIQGDKLSAAVLVADHTTGEILAYVGASDYLDAARQGGVDMIAAVRSPGSTLKPFIYGLSFESGFAHPETLIEDRPMRFGNYAPKNFDEDYHGTLTIRDALTQSLNIPAVRALSRVGPGKLVGRFRRAGVTARFPGDGEPTLAMALGGMGLTMRDLTQLYAALARGGESIELTHRMDSRGQVKAATRVGGYVKARRLMSPVAAWYVSDILKDSPPPANAKGNRFAYKTGTSYGYRDAWAVGYDGRYVIAAWIGRPDGASVPGLMGRNAAAPILYDAFARLGPKRVPLRPRPNGVVVAASANLPAPLKRWREAGDDVATGPFLSPPVVIAFPPNASELDAQDFGASPVVLKAEGGALPLTWLVDGAPLASDPHARAAEWHPATGFSKLTVIDANGRTDRVDIRVK